MTDQTRKLVASAAKGMNTLAVKKMKTSAARGTDAGTYELTKDGFYSTQNGSDIIINGITDKFVINKASLDITANDLTHKADYFSLQQG